MPPCGAAACRQSARAPAQPCAAPPTRDPSSPALRLRLRSPSLLRSPRAAPCCRSEWVGFDHHAWHHGGGTPHEASSAATFLKLNHEATAKLLNRTLHHGDAGGAGAQVMA